MILKDILNKICVKGVDKIPLGELITESTERNKDMQFSDVRSVSAHYGLISTNEFFDNSPASKETKAYKVVRPQTFAYNPARINIGSIAFSTLESPVVVSPMYIVFCVDETRVNPLFLLYWLKSKRGMHEISSRVEVGARFRLPLNSLKRIIMPLPPLGVQNQIIDKLKTMRQLIKKLDEEKELREKQYEKSLDKFFGVNLSDAENIERNGIFKLKSLYEIGSFARGKRFVREDIVNEGVPCIHYGDMYMIYGMCENKTKTFLTEEKSKKLRFAHNGDVIIVGAGENDWDIGVGMAWMGEDAAVHDACYIFEHNENPKYISYFLRSNNYHLQIRGSVKTGKICSISDKDLGKAKILMPRTRGEQDAIVEKLDVFTSLIAKLQEERDLRQKQYEYYREKLLTFEQ